MTKWEYVKLELYPPAMQHQGAQPKDGHPRLIDWFGSYHGQAYWANKLVNNEGEELHLFGEYDEEVLVAAYGRDGWEMVSCQMMMTGGQFGKAGEPYGRLFGVLDPGIVKEIWFKRPLDEEAKARNVARMIAALKEAAV